MNTKSNGSKLLKIKKYIKNKNKKNKKGVK